MNKSSMLFLKIAGLALLLLPLGSAFGQSRAAEAPWVYWDAAPRLKVQATTESSSWTHYPYPDSDERGYSRGSSTIWLELEREEPEGYGGATMWRAVKMRAEGFTTMSRHYESNHGDLESHKENGSFSQTLEVGKTSAPLENTHLTLNHDTNEWELVSPTDIEPFPVQVDGSYRTSSSDHTDVTSEVRMYTTVEGSVFTGKAIAGAGILQATNNQEFKDPDGTNGWAKNGRITVLPEWEDVKVIVTIEAFDDDNPIPFDQWRPRGSIKQPGMPGNHLTISAELRPQNMNKNAPLPEVKLFRFELLDTSREPGVAMNWPRGAKNRDKDPDLRLIIDPSSPGPLGKDAQSLEVSNPQKNAEGRPNAKARIDSFDFGGRTELRVTAELKNGRKIVGELEDAGLSYNEIRIPKRNHGEWVADVWKIDNRVTDLADDSDDESEPEGDKDNGDGLTLYEEYRGFAAKRMKGKRVEGDPKRKDLFILNLIGSDAWDGIHMFEEASGLRVVHRMVEPEILAKDRVINRNYDKAPYRKNEKGKHNDQHALVLKTLTPKQMGHHGAEVRPLKENQPGKGLRPKTVFIVALPARHDPTALVNKPFNLSPEDVAIRYPRTIVHEVLHAVGVGHHGDIDYFSDFTYMPKTYKGNDSGEAFFYMREFQSGTNTPTRRAWVKVLEEKTGENWGDRIGPAFDDILERLTARKVTAENLPAGTTFKDLDQQAQWELLWKLPNFYWKVGAEHGQHSGNEQCPMRYTYAMVYKARGALARGDETYYLVPQKSEDIGVVICESDKGTGVNGPNHKPQSRYGDATFGVGKCKKQICVNDALPLHSWGWRRP